MQQQVLPARFPALVQSGVVQVLMSAYIRSEAAPVVSAQILPEAVPVEAAQILSEAASSSGSGFVPRY